MYKSRNRQTVERFVRLVNDYAKTEHEIEFYASQLCMTAHYLGMVVKKETGITATEYRMMPEDTPCSSIEAPPPPVNDCKLLIHSMLLCFYCPPSGRYFPLFQTFPLYIYIFPSVFLMGAQRVTE